MSQNWQQPQQPHQPQQPQQPAGYGYPQQQPPAPQYGAPQPQFGGGFPPPAPQGSQGNALLAVGAAVVAALVGAFLYAFLLSAMADTDGAEPKVTQFAYAGVALGGLIGFVIAKLGGRNPGLWVVGAVLALAAVFIGELFGYAMITADLLDKVPASQLQAAGIEHTSAMEIFFNHLTEPLAPGASGTGLIDAWKEDSDALTYIFMALAPIAAVGSAYRLSNR
ncbi:hypothetical protein [Streptomyces sp. NPDC048636]|uniref:hypothetical protein n=1 Tax=Streptomyces sp. NPDC048636 TaxID=3155762 RepID=UPI00343C3107